ncbi:hypothetical protein GY45DRAFT_1379247 [Cubamyces sp. BRFM 1775]|nr:hypothetical protein GY45DRAFT_1379247 [Cubamyces sp. BRFM 1775]
MGGPMSALVLLDSIMHSTRISRRAILLVIRDEFYCFSAFFHVWTTSDEPSAALSGLSSTYQGAIAGGLVNVIVSVYAAGWTAARCVYRRRGRKLCRGTDTTVEPAPSSRGAHIRTCRRSPATAPSCESASIQANASACNRQLALSLNQCLLADLAGLDQLPGQVPRLSCPREYTISPPLVVSAARMHDGCGQMPVRLPPYFALVRSKVPDIYVAWQVLVFQRHACGQSANNAKRRRAASLVPRGFARSRPAYRDERGRKVRITGTCGSATSRS